MKKFSLVLLIGVLVFSGCSSSSSKASTVCGDLSVYEPVKTEKMTIEYFGWVGTEKEPDINYCLIQHFQAKYPNVTVKTTIPQNYNEEIESRAAAGNLPDVFPVFDIPANVTKGYVADLTDLYKNDADAKNISSSITDAMAINGKYYTIPSSLHFMGLIQNADLVESVNLSPLKYGYTMEELEAVLAATTTETTKGAMNLDIHKWYTMTVDANQGFYTFDGSQFNFDSDAFAQGVENSINYANRGYIGNVPVMGQENFNAFFNLSEGEDVNKPWLDGRIAYNYNGTWEDLANADQVKDFIGLPNGRLVLVTDYLAVSSNSKNQEMAYELAKFMGFGTEGVQARIAIHEQTQENEHKVEFSGIPLTNDAQVVSKFRELKAAYPNLLAAYNNFVENPSVASVEGLKEIPGFTQAVYTGTGFGACKLKDGSQSEDCKAEEIIDGILRGELKLSDFAQQLTTKANEAHQKALEEIKNK